MTQKVSRLLINLCSRDLNASKTFYCTYFDFEAIFESDWFVNLKSKSSGLEIGIIDAQNELVPEEVEGPPRGSYLTIIVEDVDLLYSQIDGSKIHIIQTPINTFYGQRRMLIKDPDDNVVDVSSLMK